jgi:hypothetical protein
MGYTFSAISLHFIRFFSLQAKIWGHPSSKLSRLNSLLTRRKSGPHRSEIVSGEGPKGCSTGFFARIFPPPGSWAFNRWAHHRRCPKKFTKRADTVFLWEVPYILQWAQYKKIYRVGAINLEKVYCSETGTSCCPVNFLIKYKLKPPLSAVQKISASYN